jgi:hypothetical protein
MALRRRWRQDKLEPSGANSLKGLLRLHDGNTLMQADHVAMEVSVQ